MLPSGALILLAGLLAWANGSNDVSKGIATLVGSGVTSFRTAVIWGTVWTVAGGLVAAFAAQGLVATFSGTGFLATPASGAVFLTAVAAGAVAWVLFASRTGLPVSTTHAIAGALAGAGIVSQGASALHWAFLVKRVALPLALSPLVSVGLI
jgi:PiT family inorganic phosphate transporter